MKRSKQTWLIGGLALLTIVLVTFHSVVPASGFWYYRLFDTPNGSAIRITGDVDFLKWQLDQPYVVDVNVTLLSVGASVSRLYDINLECKWVTSGFEDIQASGGPYNLTVRQKVEITFDFYPTKESYGLEINESKNGSLQYRLSFKEDIGGNNTIQSTDWEDMFNIEIHAPVSSKNDVELDLPWIGTGVDIRAVFGGGVVIGAVFGGATLMVYQKIRQTKPRKRKKLLAKLMKTCQICETLNDFDAVYCKRCGSQLS